MFIIFPAPASTLRFNHDDPRAAAGVRVVADTGARLCQQQLKQPRNQNIVTWDTRLPSIELSAQEIAVPSRQCRYGIVRRYTRT